MGWIAPSIFQINSSMLVHGAAVFLGDWKAEGGIPKDSQDWNAEGQ